MNKIGNMNFKNKELDPSNTTRRVILSSLAASLIGFAACVESGDNNSVGEESDTNNTINDDTDDSTSPECVSQEPTQADGEPIEVTVTEPDSDDLERVCSNEAISAAVATLGERRGIEDIHSRADLVPLVGPDNRVSLNLIIDDSNGRFCPEIDFEEAVNYTPSEVTVKFETEETVCSREIFVRQRVEEDA